MQEHPRFSDTKSDQFSAELLKEHLPEGELVSIPPGHIPAHVLEAAKKFGARGPLGKAFCFSSGGIQSYLMTESVTRDQEVIAQRVHLVDMQNGVVVGRAKIVRSNKEGNIPFIENIRTEEGRQQEGIGSRRLAVLGACAKAWFGEALYSSAAPSLQARKMWKSAIRQEKAQQLIEGPFAGRYKYEKPDSRDVLLP